MIATAKNKLVCIAIIAGGLIPSGYVVARQNGMSHFRDGEITQEVEYALRSDYVVPAGDIGVVTKNGDVTLSGTVPDLLMSDRAERIAATLLGVREVNNEITVKPVLRSDAEIAVDVRSALGLDPMIASRQLKVSVTDGKVLVTGTVGSSVERTRARQLAMSVLGVSGVKVDTAISYKYKRPDSSIAADINELLRTNVVYRGTALSTQVRNGRVSISGVVVSRSQRDELRDDAWLPGVKSVDVSGIEVDPTAAGPGGALNAWNGKAASHSAK